MYTVLYVDDEPGLLEIGKLFLEESGQFSVDIITSAPAALTLLNIKNYDAIVSDYQMPKMDGIEFLKRVRTSGNTIPFIIFTGKGREEIVIQALNEGADFYLQKGGEPVSQFTELTHKISQAIQKRRAEVSIRDHERREADIINFLPDATFAIDINGVVIAWNRAMEDMTGVKAEEILGKGDYEYAIPIYGERRPVIIDLVLHEDPALEAKYPVLKRDGRLIIAETTSPFLYKGRGATIWFTASPLYDTHGNITGAIESIRDVTERKQVEKALNESENRYRNVVEDQTEFISRFLPDGTHIFVNEAYCRYFGLKRDEILGHKFRPKIPVGDQERVKQFFASLTPDHPVDNIEHRIIMADGQVRWQQWSDRAIFDDSGSLIEYQSVGRDITDRKQAEETIRKSEMLLHRAEEVGRSGNWEFRLNENVVTGSEGARILYGFEGTHWTIDEVQKIPLPEYRPLLDTAMRDLIAGRSPYDVEFRIRRRTDGAVMDIHALAEYDPERNVIFGVFHDITDRKQAEEALREKNKKLNLLSNITRKNINNQVAVMQRFAKLAALAKPDPDIADFVARIASAIDSIHNHIEFTQTYQDLGIQAPAWLRVCEEFRSAKPPEITLVCTCDLCEIFVDPMIKKVFVNLFDNTVKFGERVTTATIRCEQVGDELVITFADNGIGIPLDEKQKIFEKGYGQNTGFGLFLASEILSITGITIRETGEPGDGARFEILVPKGAFRFADQ